MPIEDAGKLPATAIYNGWHCVTGIQHMNTRTTRKRKDAIPQRLLLPS